MREREREEGKEKKEKQKYSANIKYVTRAELSKCMLYLKIV